MVTRNNCNEDFYLNTNLKYLRKLHKESQAKLGAVINKKDSTIGNYEKGIRYPDYVDLYFIAKHYNVTIDDLIKKDFRKENK